MGFHFRPFSARMEACYRTTPYRSLVLVMSANDSGWTFAAYHVHMDQATQTCQPEVIRTTDVHELGELCALTVSDMVAQMIVSGVQLHLDGM